MDPNRVACQVCLLDLPLAESAVQEQKFKMMQPRKLPSVAGLSNRNVTIRGPGPAGKSCVHSQLMVASMGVQNRA